MSGSRTGRSQVLASKPANRGGGEKAASGRASKPALPKAPSLKPPSSRAARAAERRQAILEAALDEFVARGFAATRLEGVGKRSGTDEGTNYVDFNAQERLGR